MARLPLALQLWISAVCLLLVCFYFYLPGVPTQDFQKGVVHMRDAPVGDFTAVEKKGICDKFVDSFTSVVQEKSQVVFIIGSCVALYIAVRISFLGAKGGYISHGTTNIVMKFREYIILGVDSKVTLIDTEAGKHVERHVDRIENCIKWHSILRPNGRTICATSAGYQYSCNQTWEHMQEYVQTHPDASVEEIAKYAEGIPRSWKEYAGNYIAAMFIAGFDDDGTPQVYVHQDSLEAKDSFIIPEDCCAIGSGSEAAIQGWEKTLEYISKHKRKKTSEPSSLEEALKMVEISLLFASLKDYQTGGLLTVLLMSPNETKVRPTCIMPVSRLYYKHYSCLKYLEKESVFAFYKPNMMTEAEFAEVMRCAGGRIRPGKMGHVFTCLAGGYFIRRVTFKHQAEVNHLLGKAISLEERLVFSEHHDRIRLLKYRKRGRGKKYKLLEVYISKHQKIILGGLNINEPPYAPVQEDLW